VEDVLSRPDIDCVIVASETNKHADLAIAAMEAGKGGASAKADGDYPGRL
jgi:predicted dehydrogenase